MRFGPDDELSAPSVRKRLPGGGETTPVQVLDADRWPEGLNTLAYRLNPARQALPEDSDRGGAHLGAATTTSPRSRSSADLWDWRTGVFDFRGAEGRRVTEKSRKERGRGAAGR